MNKETTLAFDEAKNSLRKLALTLQASANSDEEAEVVTLVKAMWADLDWKKKELEKYSPSFVEQVIPSNDSQEV